MVRSRFALLLVVLTGLFAPSAEAQSRPISLQVSREFAQSLEVAPALNGASQAEALRLNTQQNRGGWLISAGTGFLTAGVAHALMFGGQGVCYEPDERLSTPPVLGGAVAALGAALIAGGAYKLATLPSGYRAQHPRSPGNKVGKVFAALGISVGTQALLLLTAAPGLADCISS